VVVFVATKILVFSVAGIYFMEAETTVRMPISHSDLKPTYQAFLF